jgi:hypothetical protein
MKITTALFRFGRAAKLAWTLIWAVIAGVAQGIFSVLVLLTYRACLLLALAAGVLLFALFRIDTTKQGRDVESSPR